MADGTAFVAGTQAFSSLLAVVIGSWYCLKQKESNTQRFERNLLKQSTKASHPFFFFYIAHNVLLTPVSFQFYFSPQFFLFPSPQFYYFPSSMFLFPSPQFYYFPSSMFLFPSPQFLLFSLLNVFYSPPPPPHFYCFLSTTTTATFLLFSLHHHHNHHHMSIVFPRPPLPLVVPPWGLVCRGRRVTKRVFKGRVSWWKCTRLFGVVLFWLGFWKTNCRLASVAVAWLLG